MLPGGLAKLALRGCRVELDLRRRRQRGDSILTEPTHDRLPPSGLLLTLEKMAVAQAVEVGEKISGLMATLSQKAFATSQEALPRLLKLLKAHLRVNLDHIRQRNEILLSPGGFSTIVSDLPGLDGKFSKGRHPRALRSSAGYTLSKKPLF